MKIKGLTLFGKHPAWSDHMFVTFDTEKGHHLKHVFYDRTVIPALQGGDGDQRISETWNFLVSIDRQVFCMVSVPSRDSVGRSRFPLVVAYPLPANLRIEAAMIELNALAHELRELLRDIMNFPGDNLNQWQADVKLKAEAFKSKVDWSSVDSKDTSEILPRNMIASLMTRLLDEHDALSVKSCSFAEGCGLFLVGLKQFKSPHPALLVFDQENQPDALFFASTQEGSSFHLKRRLYGNLPPLLVSEGNVPPKVNRLLEVSVGKEDKMLSVEDVPSLKLDENRKPSSRKPFFLAIFFALIASIIIGFFLGKTENSESFVVPEKDLAQIDSVRERWNANAVSYIEWIQPLEQYVAKQSVQINGFEAVAKNLTLNLNPFDTVGGNVPDMKLAKSPPAQISDTDTINKLNKVYDNIDQLKASLIAYYEQQFSNSLSAKLKQSGYTVPTFTEVDFSQQSLSPDFGSQFVEQLDACLKCQDVLTELSSAISDLERVVVEPLYKTYPEHAKLIRDHVQGLIKDSVSLKQFQEQYNLFLQTIHYPEFTDLDSLNFEALSADEEWLVLPQQSPSLQSISKLMELLEAYRKREVSRRTADADKKDLKLPVQLPDEQSGLPSQKLTQFNVPEATTAEDSNTPKAVSPILERVRKLTTEEKIDASKLAAITEAFNVLDTADVSDELENSIRLAFNKFIQKLRSSATENILPIYVELENYLPESMHTSQDAARAEIAAYWNRYHSVSNPALTEKNDLKQLAVAAEQPVVRQFFEQLSSMTEKNGQAMAENEHGKLDDLVQNLHEDRSRLEITFTGNDVKLVFLPVETKNGEIFVQQSPLRLKQFIRLSNLCGMDTEYSLASQDSLWPRCFEVGMGQSFHMLNEWQFRNGAVFASIKPFSARMVPAHLNEPREILRLAGNLGFRLLRPEECADFVRLTDSSTLSTIQMSIEDQKNIEYFNTIESSVYAELITDSIEQGTWSGGIDFERGTPDEKQFSDVVGGASELAYDGTDFYAFGGSWLYSPSDPAECVRIAKPSQMYIDLSIRFVADLPESQNYGELVQELALQFLTQEN